MTKIINNPLLKGASGKLGDTVVYKKLANGDQIMANKASKRKSISEKQKESSARFRQATQYAKMQMSKPDMKDEYKKGTTYNKSTPYRVALTDYLNAPVIHYVKAFGYTGAVGDIISIKVTDDFRVAAVEVEIVGAQGVVLEKGSAEQNPRKRFMWKYRTTVANAHIAGTIIKVKAFDLPKNCARGEVVL